MFVGSKLVGRWNGTKYVFEPLKERVLTKAKPAYALGGSSSSSEYVPTGPWSPQIPYINQLMQQADALYNQGAPGYYPGQTVVPSTPALQQTQQNAITGGTNAANTAGAGANLALSSAAGTNPVLQAGTNSLPAFYQSLANLNTAGTGATNLATSLNPNIYQAITGAMNQQYTPQSAPQVQAPNVGNVATPNTAAPTVGAGNIDLTQSLTQSLQGGAMNPYLSQLTDAALRDSTRQYQTSVIPSINSGAAASGNVGSSRQGIAQGLAAQGLQQQQTDVMSQLYGTAFNQAAQQQTAAQGIVSNAQAQNVQANQSQQQINAAIQQALFGQNFSTAQLGTEVGSQNAQFQLQQQQINAAIQQALTGQSLAGAQLGTSLYGTGANASQAAGGLSSNLFAQGGAQSLDQLYRALATIPALTGAQTSGLSAANTGALQDYSLQQAQRDADVERYFYNAFAPYNSLTQYQNYVTGGYGSSAAPPNTGYNPYGGQPVPGLYYPGQNSGGQPQNPNPGTPITPAYPWYPTTPNISPYPRQTMQP